MKETDKAFNERETPKERKEREREETGGSIEHSCQDILAEEIGLRRTEEGRGSCSGL